MNKVNGRLTVFFEAPFWIGVFEQVCDEKLSVCKITFGAEPKDCEVYSFILEHYNSLKFSAAIKTENEQDIKNPKRRQRNIKKHLQDSGISTKSQQAVAKQREEAKREHKQVAKTKKDAIKQYKFTLKQQKRREKHRGH